MKPFLTHVLRHLIIFTLLILGTITLIFILGMFNTLHPDAYIDGIMSIVYVYGLIIVVLVLYHFINRYLNIDIQNRFKRFVLWQKTISVFAEVAFLFTLITVINSIMMVTGIDTPKRGVFAYEHLLIRLLIVIFAVVIWNHKAILIAIRSLFKRNSIPKADKQPFIYKLSDSYNKPIQATFNLFTIFTVALCLIIVLFQNMIMPEGGWSLYLWLIILYGILLLIGLVRFYAMSRQVSKKDID